MNSSTRVRSALGAALVVLALVTAVGASARNLDDDDDDGGGDALRATLVPSAAADAAIHGVNPAGDWRLRRGSARIERDGELRVDLSRLVLRATGRNDSVASVRAALYCSGTRADVTRSARLSRRGDARIRDELNTPRRCLAPTVLVQPNGNDRVFVAATGFVD
jgi:hypothetical protein